MLAALTPFIASTVTHLQEVVAPAEQAAVAAAPAEKAAAPTTPGIGFVYVCPTAEGVEFEPYAMYEPRHSPATSRRPARPRLSACNWRGSEA